MGSALQETALVRADRLVPGFEGYVFLERAMPKIHHESEQPRDAEISG